MTSTNSIPHDTSNETSITWPVILLKGRIMIAHVKSFTTKVPAIETHTSLIKKPTQLDLLFYRKSVLR